MFLRPARCTVNHDDVLGVLSLLVWALIIVVSVKYIAIVMHADNDGEGGILALTALVLPGRRDQAPPRDAAPFTAARPFLVLFGPAFAPFVLPIALTVIVALFVMQRFGTHVVGSLFGPIMVTWFVTLTVLGLIWIVQVPSVLMAVTRAGRSTPYAPRPISGSRQNA